MGWGWACQSDNMAASLQAIGQNMQELTDRQRGLREAARSLAAETIAPRASATDLSEEYPWDNVRALVDAGFMGMTIPEAYGGKGASYLDAALVIEEMAKVCGVTARIVVEGNMGAIGAKVKARLG